MTEIIKIRKLGTSTAISIPQPILRALGIKNGDEMELSIFSSDSLILRKKAERDGWLKAWMNMEEMSEAV